MSFYSPEKKYSPSNTKTLTHSVKRLYRRTNKIDAAEFNMRKSSHEHGVRQQYTEQELDEWLTQTFARLYDKNRFDALKFFSKADLILEGLRLGSAAKKIYFALEKLLNKRQISSNKISLKDIWIFALYQTLRSVERQNYQDQHIYTSEIGKRNSAIVIATLNSTIPGWLDSAGKINKC